MRRFFVEQKTTNNSNFSHKQLVLVAAPVSTGANLLLLSEVAKLFFQIELYSIYT